MEGFIWVLQNLFPWILFAIVNAVRRILKRNEIYSDVHKSGRVKDILSSVAENKARLGASHVIKLASLSLSRYQKTIVVIILLLRRYNMKSFLFLLLLVINLEVFANPIFKRNLVTGIDFNNDGLFDRDVYNCITSDIYDGNTAVSFWGDSRLDLVDVPIYGHSSLDVYLGANGWNVQNFGVGGRQSRGLNDEITECFKRETDYIPERLDSNGVWIGGGDPLKPYYTNATLSSRQTTSSQSRIY